MSFFKFIFSKVFFVNLFIALLIVTGLLFFVIAYFDNFTHHDEKILIPDVTGKHASTLDSLLIEQGFEYIITDSIFDRKKPKGVVIDQKPSPGCFVKEGRRLYLIINARTTKKIKIKESMIDLSVKDALSRLQSYGVQVVIKTKPSNPPGVVLDVTYKGEKIDTTTWINDGSTVTLWVSGASDATEFLNDYVGLNVKDAKSRVQANSFSPLLIQKGTTLCKTENDSLSAIVVHQRPKYEQGLKLPIGTTIELYFTCDTNFVWKD